MKDEVIRTVALKAAKDAADHMFKKNATKVPNSMGTFALFNWGSLVLVCAVYATVLGINLEDLTFQLPQVAQVDAPLEKHTVVKVQPSSDSVPDGAIALKVAKLDTDQRTSTPNVSLPAELSELPAPLVSKAEQQVDQVAAIQDDRFIDDLQTGSVKAFSEEDLQPFPDDILPVNLFAMDIDGAKAIAPLIGRYSALKRWAPDLFSDLEPRIQLKGTNASLEARLIAGPFTSQNQVAQFCRSLRLRLTVDCTMSSFEDDTIQ